MNQKLLEKAKSLCKDCGIKENNLQVAINTIGGSVADDCNDETTIDKATNDVLAVAKAMQSEATSRVEEYRKNHPEPKPDEPKPDEPKSDEPKGGNDKDDLAKVVASAVAEAMKPISEKIATMEGANISKSRMEKLNEKLATCKNDEFKTQTLKSYGRMAFKDDADFDAYLKDVDNDIVSVNKKASEESVSSHAPLQPKLNSEGISENVASYIEAGKNTDGNKGGEFSGKQI